MSEVRFVGIDLADRVGVAAVGCPAFGWRRRGTFKAANADPEAGQIFGILHVEKAGGFAVRFKLILRAGKDGQRGGLGEVEAARLVLDAVPDSDRDQAASFDGVQVACVFEDRSGAEVIGVRGLAGVDVAYVLGVRRDGASRSGAERSQNSCPNA
jgi:hypothetical protein